MLLEVKKKKKKGRRRRMWKLDWVKKKKESPLNNPWLYLSRLKNVVGAQSCVPERLGSWLPDPQCCGKAASEKCHKQGEEEEGALSACE